MSERQSSADFHREYKERKAKQTEALTEAGFSPAFSAEGFMGFGGTEFTFCRVCGCAIPLVEGQEDEKAPIDLHRASHAGD